MSVGFFLDISISFRYFIPWLLLSRSLSRIKMRVWLFLKKCWFEVRFPFSHYQRKILVSFSSVFHTRRRLRTRSSVPRMTRRQGWLSFSHFAMCSRNYDNAQQQKKPRQCRKRKTKKYCPDGTNVTQMECGGKKRKKDQQTLTILSNNVALKRNVAPDLPRTVYLMHILDNLRHQKWAFMRSFVLHW